jgi:hypothetical protein
MERVNAFRIASTGSICLFGGDCQYAAEANPDRTGLIPQITYRPGNLQSPCRNITFLKGWLA